MLRCWWPEDQAWSTTELGERLSCSIRGSEKLEGDKSDIHIVPGNSPGWWEPAPYILVRTGPQTPLHSGPGQGHVHLPAWAMREERTLGWHFPGTQVRRKLPWCPSPAPPAERHHGPAPGCWEPGSEVSRQPCSQKGGDRGLGKPGHSRPTRKEQEQGRYV